MNILNKIYIAVLICLAVLSACQKEKGEMIGFLSPNIKYQNQSINMVVGGELAQSEAMLTDESTKPLEFSIAAIKREDGSIATAVGNYKVDTYFWHASYTGTEVDIEEVNSKRDKVNRPAIDINPANGQIIIYPEARDTTILTKGKYILDIKVKNSAEERIIQNALTINISYAGDYFYTLRGTTGLKELKTTITRKEKTGNKITVRVLDKNNNPVNPKEIIGYEDGINQWSALGLKNPTKYTAFPDRIEMEVSGYPLPAIPGNYILIDMINNGSITGEFLNYWFRFALYEPGIWDIELKLDY